MIFLLISGPVYAESPAEKSAFPIPQEVSEIVTWTQLCKKWIEVENDSSGEREAFMQNLIETTPALTWARSNCSYEELESKIIDLQEKYKNDPMTTFIFDHLIGTYKD